MNACTPSGRMASMIRTRAPAPRPKTTALAPLAAKCVTDPMKEADGSAVLVACARWSEATTSADVIVLPSSNLTPVRNCRVNFLLPLEKAQLVARSGTILRPTKSSSFTTKASTSTTARMFTTC